MPRQKKVKEEKSEMSEVLSILKDMNKRLTLLENPEDTPTEQTEEPTPQQVFDIPTQAPEPTTNIVDRVAYPSEPIPPVYRERVNKILNPSFEVRIKGKLDSPAFDFIVVVPKKYSNASEEYLKFYHEDLRRKVVTFAEGVNGVVDFLNKVWDSFDNETKAMISAERSNLLNV